MMSNQIINSVQHILLRALALDVVLDGKLSNEIELGGAEHITSFSDARKDTPLVILNDKVNTFENLTSSINLDYFLVGSLIVKLSDSLAQQLSSEHYKKLEEGEILIFGDTIYGHRDSSETSIDITRNQFYKCNECLDEFKVMPLNELTINYHRPFDNVSMKQLYDRIPKLQGDSIHYRLRL